MNQAVKIAVIGGGNNGQGHAGSFAGMNNVMIAAIVEPGPQKQNELREHFPDTHLYQDYREMFSQETVDAVCVSTPHNCHYEQVMAALENNCHVLLEKPMALKAEHCREIVSLAEQKKLILQVGFECRESKLYQRIKEIIESGEIGALLSMSFIHYRGGWKNDWYRRRESGGNSITIIETCHYIDLMRHWSGKDVEWAFASSPGANFRTDYEYPDTGFCQLGFQDGVLASIIDSHARSADCFLDSRPAADKSYGTMEGEYMDPVYGHQFEYSITGTKGSLWVRMLNKQISVLEKKTSSTNKQRVEITLKRVEDYNKQSLHDLVHNTAQLDRRFIQSIRNGEPPVFSPADALKSHLAAFAIEKSERTGEKVVVQY